MCPRVVRWTSGFQKERGVGFSCFLQNPKDFRFFSPVLQARHHLLCVLGQYLVPLFSCCGSAVELSLHPAES